MPKTSAGILLFRRRDALEVLLVHLGGPFWARKDEGAWGIPKGEIEPGEEPLAAALREFEEETGGAVQAREAIALGEIRQPSGKVVHAWACEGDFDPARLRSVSVTMEWPPRSGRHQEFPEVDRAAWFTVDGARSRMQKGQVELLDRLLRHLASRPGARA